MSCTFHVLRCYIEWWENPERSQALSLYFLRYTRKAELSLGYHRIYNFPINSGIEGARHNIHRHICNRRSHRRGFSHGSHSRKPHWSCDHPHIQSTWNLTDLLIQRRGTRPPAGSWLGKGQLPHEVHISSSIFRVAHMAPEYWPVTR